MSQINTSTRDPGKKRVRRVQERAELTRGKLLKEDMEYVYKNKQALQDKFKDIFVDIQG